MTTPKILIQLDPDHHASSFDAVVAVDAGIDQLLQYHEVEPTDVRDLVYGAIFTRGPEQLKNTAIFVGGSDVQRAEKLTKHVTDTFFGPMRVSVMMDANGANTTAAAAVVAAARHLSLAGATATVLAGTGPVGQRVARLLAGEGCDVRVASRSEERAAAVCKNVKAMLDPAGNSGALSPVVIDSPDDTGPVIAGSQLVIAAGAAGIQLLSELDRQGCEGLQVAIDLNAVPPLGIEGAGVADKAVDHDGVICYGAIGVGGTKMKIHRAALQALFAANDQVLDAPEIFRIGRDLDA